MIHLDASVMRSLIPTFLTAVALASPCQAQGAARDTVTLEYDRFDLATTAHLNIGTVGGSIEMEVSSRSPGQAVPSRLRATTILFLSKSNAWRQLRYRNVQVIADGIPVPISGSHFDGRVVDRGVAEIVVLSLSPSQFTMVARARVAEFKIGLDVITMSSYDMARLRGFFAFLSGADPQQRLIKQAFADNDSVTLERVRRLSPPSESMKTTP